SNALPGLGSELLLPRSFWRRAAEQRPHQAANFGGDEPQVRAGVVCWRASSGEGQPNRGGRSEVRVVWHGGRSEALRWLRLPRVPAGSQKRSKYQRTRRYRVIQGPLRTLVGGLGFVARPIRSGDRVFYSLSVRPIEI